MLALFAILLTIPLGTAAVIGPVAAASEIMPRLPAVERPSHERIAEAKEPKRRSDSQFRHERTGTPSRAQAKPEDCDPEDRRCEVQRKLGRTVDDRRTRPRKGRRLPGPGYNW